jgi:hypothetical protein
MIVKASSEGLHNGYPYVASGSMSPSQQTLFGAMTQQIAESARRKVSYIARIIG